MHGLHNIFYFERKKHSCSIFTVFVGRHLSILQCSLFFLSHFFWKTYCNYKHPVVDATGVLNPPLYAITWIAYQMILLRLTQKALQLPFQFFFSRPVFWMDCLKFFSNVLSFNNKKAWDQDRTYFIGYIKKKFAQLFFKMLFAIRVNHVTPCVLPIRGNQHSQHQKNYRNLKLGNKTEGNTGESTVKGEIDLVSRKGWSKIKEGVQKKKVIDTQCESNISTVAEEPVSSENIAS